MRSGRPAYQAARTMTQTAAWASSTRVSTADHPKTGGLQPEGDQDPPGEALGAGPFAQLGGGPGRRQSVRFFCRLGFQGITVWAPRAVWIQAISSRPREPASRRTARGRMPKSRTARSSRGASAGRIAEDGRRRDLL